MGSTFLGLQSIAALVLDGDQFVAWTVDRIIARGGITFLVARPGAGKSLLAYYIAACVLTGNPLFGIHAVEQGAVAYIDLDGRKSIARMRAIAALHGVGLDDDEIATLPLFIGAQRSSADLRDPIVLQTVLGELAAIPNLMLVVLDTFSDLHHGKEGSPDDMTDTVSGAVEIANRFDCGVLIIHHARKNGGNELEDVRGASSIVAKADAVFILKTERDDDDDPGRLTLLQRKARLTEEAKARHLVLEANGEVDGTLHSYTFALAETAKSGRPATTSKEAGEITTRLLWQDPDMPRVELVKQLMAAGIPQATAYRAANVHYQKKNDPGVTDNVIKPQSVTGQGEARLSSTPERPDTRGAADSFGITGTVADDLIADAWSALITWASGRCDPFTEVEEEAARLVALRIVPGESWGSMARRVFEQQRAWRTGSAEGMAADD